ncbi:MAG: aconitate hydratase AcnA [Collinsella sp.]|nr:aconitate hydratase AcnA [Collinsella sp.]
MTETQTSERFARHELEVGGERLSYFSITDVEGAARLPVGLKILVENVLRCVSDPDRALAQAREIVRAGMAGEPGGEIEFMPARVLFQDFTGVPVFVDFAAMRDAAARRGADPSLINPQIPCTLVVDHSVTADVVSCPSASEENARIEAERNSERFSFLKWSAESFENVQIIPPGVGICHQLNIERLCRVAWRGPIGDGDEAIYFDTLVGTDSHTPTANGMGVLGWGVGGIEAEAAALGQPITMRVPSVIGVRLVGSLPGCASAMDVALTFAERLRARGVVGSLVECFGPGVGALTPTQRATIANMSPEYGCTATLFPADDATLDQMALMGAGEHDIELARAYLDVQGLLGSAADVVVYSDVVEIDLSTIEPSLAGPSRPHNRVPLSGARDRFNEALRDHGRSPLDPAHDVTFDSRIHEIRHGALAIAAVTSCTTATDPAMMVAAGLVARRAVELGCEPLPWVKKVLAPGSHSTTELLRRAGLLEPLAELGFSVCGWGCMSCIGNSGPLFDPMHEIAGDCELTSILSGNRNFDGRISPDVAQNYLAAPALVVAYSLAGTMDIDLTSQPVCQGREGAVMLADLLPTAAQIDETLSQVLTPAIYAAARGAATGDGTWRALPSTPSSTFSWSDDSTYVREPPYFDDRGDAGTFELQGARVLANLGDFVTTDHISPAGSIMPGSPAAIYLEENGVAESDFNTYGSRRGNHEVMMRGCFANVRLQNKLARGRMGGWTRDPWSDDVVSIFDAARSARRHGAPLVILAGKMYGSGSSRDWAAKAPALLGVRAVIAESFERIHRSNLVGMGILPLQFKEGEGVEALGLDGTERIDIAPVDFSQGMPDPSYAHVTAHRTDGSRLEFEARVRVDTETEGAYLASAGILPFVLDQLID